jgi:hypothetical protein
MGTPSRLADDLFGRPLFLCQFPDDFLADAVRKLALSPETFFAFFGVLLRHACGIAALMAATLQFPTDNRFVFLQQFGYFFSGQTHENINFAS